MKVTKKKPITKRKYTKRKYTKRKYTKRKYTKKTIKQRGGGKHVERNKADIIIIQSKIESIISNITTKKLSSILKYIKTNISEEDLIKKDKITQVILDIAILKKEITTSTLLKKFITENKHQDLEQLKILKTHAEIQTRPLPSKPPTKTNQY